MDDISVYLPMDRRQALVRNETLAQQTTGTVLFAAISNLTPLTNALMEEYGEKRGPEELARQLDYVYDILIAQVNRYRGSVINFAHDSLTCWFDKDDGRRATAAGLLMQQEMGKFAALQSMSGSRTTLAMRVGITHGPVQRFVVGNPAIQRLDLFVGDPLARMVTAEQQARRGEVVVDERSAQALGDAIEITEVRPGSLALVERLRRPIPPPTPWPPIRATSLSLDQLQPWLPPFVYKRFQAGQGEFPSEMRSVVALLLSFSGLDYQQEGEISHKLDRYIRWVQETMARYEGTLLDATLMDKGGYLYAIFGIPVAHEDDSTRAALAAWALRSPPEELNYITGVRIGLSQGRLRAGAYGGQIRRTYNVLGEEVNLAARLMQYAAPGQVLATGRIQAATAHRIRWHELPGMRVRGHLEPIQLFYMRGVSSRQTLKLLEPSYDLPMVGRESELAKIEAKFSLALLGEGQIVGITAEAGMGKSRLLAEVLRMARARSVVAYGGECHVHGSNTPYLVWQPIWRTFFGLDETWSPEAQRHALERELNRIAPQFLPRLPLLDQALPLPIPENDLTRSMDAHLRKLSRESLLVECLKIRATNTPMMLVLEDLHWVDPLSRDLLEAACRAISTLPVLIVLAYRPSDIDLLQSIRVATLPHFSEIRLQEFNTQEAGRLIALKLTQVGKEIGSSPTNPNSLTSFIAMVKKLAQQAQGNPFYIEELLNFLRDRGLDPRESASWQEITFPDTLHGLILSRFDQLNDLQKKILGAASVIGRLFRLSWLLGYCPWLGDPAQVQAELETMNRLDLTPMEAPAERTYLFKHIVTQEVAYNSLDEATRRALHEHLARYLEAQMAAGTLRDLPISLLTYHYERSENLEKKREYLRRAGDAAQVAYANQTAIDYYQRLLALLGEQEPHRGEILLLYGTVLERVGRWQEAQRGYLEALALAEQRRSLHDQARCQLALGSVLEKVAHFDEAIAWLEKARNSYERQAAWGGVGQSLTLLGEVLQRQGAYEQAQQQLEGGLALARKAKAQSTVISALYMLGVVALNRGDRESAQNYLEQSLALSRKEGDPQVKARALSFLGAVVLNEQQPALARQYLEEALALHRESGDRRGIANAQGNLGYLLYAQEELALARRHLEDCLRISQELGDKLYLAYMFVALAAIAIQEQPTATSRARRATRLAGVVATLLAMTGAVLEPYEQGIYERTLNAARALLGEAEFDNALADGAALTLEEAVAYALDAG
ncbi:MAG: tetratricopeptide repeat protein [Ardenticatenales bacterium]|nr:tetratricopeptide repeat protein [Ardenticatenales bacterium]